VNLPCPDRLATLTGANFQATKNRNIKTDRISNGQCAIRLL